MLLDPNTKLEPIQPEAPTETPTTQANLQDPQSFVDKALLGANRLADDFLKFFGINARGGKEKQAAAAQAQAAVAETPAIQYKPSPIKEQHRDLRGQSDYSPLLIVFLEGAYAAQRLDLGFNINELSSEQNAEWSDQSAHNIRPGANFTSISPRTFSVSLVYFALNDDVTHLVENVAHLHEITDGLSAPPKLLLQHGDLVAVPVVCTSLRSHYEDPLPQKRGFRRCTVELSFKLLGGRGSPHALGRPLTGTPLFDYKQTTSKLDRQKQGEQAKLDLVLAPCLTAESNNQIKNLVDSRRLNDPQEIAKLSPNAFVQAAIAGFFSERTLKDSALEEKLKVDLANQIAAEEVGLLPQQNGVGALPPTELIPLQKALVSGDASALPAKWQEVFSQLKVDYDLILKATMAQDFNRETSELWKRTKAIDGQAELLTHSSAVERLADLASCALSLRQVGAPTMADISPKSEEANLLNQLNQLLDPESKVSDETLKQVFGLESEAQIRTVRRGYPYTSYQEFLRYASRDTLGATSYVLWERHRKYVELLKSSGGRPSYIPEENEKAKEESQRETGNAR